MTDEQIWRGLVVGAGVGALPLLKMALGALKERIGENPVCYGQGFAYGPGKRASAVKSGLRGWGGAER